jgi:hypothetical protein
VQMRARVLPVFSGGPPQGLAWQVVGAQLSCALHRHRLGAYEKDQLQKGFWNFERGGMPHSRAPHNVHSYPPRALHLRSHKSHWTLRPRQ